MANPVCKCDVWYYHYRHYAKGWLRERMGAAKTAAAPNGIGEREAKRLNAEKQAKHDRIRQGHEAPPTLNEDTTFAGMVEWFIDKRMEGTPSHRAKAPSLRKHLIEWRPPVDLEHPEYAQLPLGPRPPAEVTAGRVTDFFKYKVDKGEIAAGSANGLRASIRAIFNAAIEAGRFYGKNPITAKGVKPTPEPKRVPRYLEEEWIARILDDVPAHYAGMFATGIYVGLRKGEICALKKADVNFDKMMIYVRGSHDRDIPKSGYEEGLPIPPELVPYLRKAIAASNGPLVFPRPDGKQHHVWLNLSGILRSSLKRIGFGVIGYRLKCRRPARDRWGHEKTCGYVSEVTTDGNVQPCPRCGFALWVCPEVEPFRFHDTRHTTATLLIQFGAPKAGVQKLMRHRNAASTERYAHAGRGYMQDVAGLMSFRPEPVVQDETADVESVQPARAVAGGDDQFGTPLVPGAESQCLGGAAGERKAESDSVVTSEREKGFEPSTSTLARGPQVVAGGSNQYQLGAITYNPSDASVQPARPVTFQDDQFSTPLVPGLVPVSTVDRLSSTVHLRALPDHLLTTAEVATHLGASKWTVYKLCATGALPHVRVLGAIRVKPSDLAAFIASRRVEQFPLDLDDALAPPRGRR
jgi:integrase